MNKFIILSVLLFTAACSVETNTAAPPPDQNKVQSGAIGPYTITFDTNNAYSHSFTGDFSRDQNEGAVDYYLTTVKDTTIEFLETSAKFSGCDASTIKHQTFWIPDLSRPNMGYEVAPKMNFKSLAGVQGTLRHSFKGISGCTGMELKVSLRIKPAVVKACAESTDKNCRVDVYCKEEGNFSTYAEVEVWKESWATTLRHFMKHSDGTRGQLAMTSTTSADQSGTLKYTGSNSTLTINKTTGKGAYIETFSGREFRVDLNCQIFN